MNPFDLLEAGMVAGAPSSREAGSSRRALFRDLFGKAVKQVYGEPIVIQGGAHRRGRSRRLTAKWLAAGPVIVLTRFGRFLSNKVFNVPRRR